MFGTSAPPRLSLRVLLSTRQCLLSAVLALSHQASIRSFCRSKEFALVYNTGERLAGVGYLLSVHLLTRGEADGFCT
jgi:hypothetical protein